MIETYVAIGLLGLGYFVNKTKPAVIPARKAPVPPAELPPRNLVSVARAAEFDAVSRAKVQEVRSQLTGATLDVNNFHNNMVPFYRGAVKQNMNPAANEGLLESFGAAGMLRPKKEVDPFFAQAPNANNFDAVGRLEDFKDRRAELGVGRLQNNVLPFEQVKVGQGVGQGFSARPAGGFHQIETNELVRLRNVDEMRTASRPKVSGLPGRTVDGLKGSVRGEPGAMNKNRVPTVFENSEDNLFKTTGAFTRPAQIPQPQDKYTARRDTAVEYKGAAGFVGAKGEEQRPGVHATMRPMLPAFDTGAAVAATKGTGGGGGDYGAASIQVYSNERDVTTVRTHKSNLTSVVKAIVAPIVDAVKTARKEFLVEAPRPNGMLQAQIPSKITVYDTNDVARTTIKETLIHDADMLNLKGSRKITVYDPNDVARTTMKETLIHDADPTYNFKPVGAKGQVYAASEARSTVRETTDPAETTLNMARVALKPQVHDPDDVARTTIKQTTSFDVPFGQVSGAPNAGNGAYRDEVYDVKTTQKETFVDTDHYGGAQMGRGGGDAYSVANFEAKDRQQQNPTEYFGSAGVGEGAVAAKSYADVYNATINDLKEAALVVDHAPTASGIKAGTSAADMGEVAVNRLPLPETGAGAQLPQRMPNTVQPPTADSMTHARQAVRQDDRLDLEILEPFRRNPFTQPLDSAPAR